MGLRGQATTINPPGTVVSVNGRAGAVVLTPADVGITGGAATRIPVFSSASALAGHAGFTFDPATGILATPEIDIGATPFVFKDLGGGVCQIADPALYWDSVNGTLFIGSSGGVNISSTPGTAMVIQADPGRTLQLTSGAIDITVSPAGADEIDLTLGDGTTGFYMVPAMLQPVTDNGLDIGSAAHPWRTGYFGTSVVNAGYDEFGTSAGDPSAPTAAARLYSKVVAGKQKLYALFPSGAAQLIASEP